MSEVECVLSTGDILGIPNIFREKLVDIKIQLESFRKSVEQQKPNTDEMYTVNQNILTDDDTKFLRGLLYNNPEQICGVPLHIGWYPELFYDDYDQNDEVLYNQLINQH